MVQFYVNNKHRHHEKINKALSNFQRQPNQFPPPQNKKFSLRQNHFSEHFHNTQFHEQQKHQKNIKQIRNRFKNIHIQKSSSTFTNQP